ncbi:MAG: polysaccharide deacetylase family protein [Cytophagaceae bacterium]
MKDFLLKYLSVGSYVFPVSWLSTITGQRFIAPFYHCISDEPVSHIRHLYSIKNKKSFEKDLDYLLKYFEPLNLSSLLDSINTDRPLKKNTFLLSFDDGLKEFYNVAAPILKRKGVPAVCFLNSDFLDNKDLFFRYKASLLIEKLKSERSVKKVANFLKEKEFSIVDLKQYILCVDYNSRAVLDELAQILEVNFNEYLEKEKPYMDSGQVKGLIKQGFYFGAHSVDHPMFCEISEEAQLWQIQSSVSDICQKFDLDYKVFSFPFSDYGVNESLFEKMYRFNNSLVDLSFGTAGIKMDVCKNHVQRIPMEYHSFSARKLIFAEYLYYMIKAPFNKNRIIRKYGDT